MIAPTADPSAAVSAYQQAFRRLRELPGFTPAQALRAEAGVILKTWAGRTKVATQANIDLNVRRRAARAAYATRAGASGSYTSINVGMRGPQGRIWFRTRRNKFQYVGQVSPDAGSLRYNNLHFKNDDWAGITGTIETYRAEIARRTPLARHSAGLARQSVLQIADALAIDLNKVKGGGSLSSAGIAKARAALASSGRAYRNGTGHQAGANISAYVELINTLPYGRKIGMDSTLLGVLAGRARFIDRLYGLGVFDSQAKTARAFPNLISVQSGN